MTYLHERIILRRNILRKENHFFSMYTFYVNCLPFLQEHDHVSKKLTPKCSSGHVECNFDKPTENMLFLKFSAISFLSHF